MRPIAVQENPEHAQHSRGIFTRTPSTYLRQQLGRGRRFADDRRFIFAGSNRGGGRNNADRYRCWLRRWSLLRELSRRVGRKRFQPLGGRKSAARDRNDL